MAAKIEKLKAPARRMLDRGQEALEDVLRKAGTKGLGSFQSSTSEVDFFVAAARLAIDHPGNAVDGTEKKIDDARLRGLTHLVELHKEAEPQLGTGQVCELLGLAPKSIRKKVSRNQLLALPRGRDRVFPSFQFKDGNIVPRFGEVLGALDADSVFVALSFYGKKPAFWQPVRH